MTTIYGHFFDFHKSNLQTAILTVQNETITNIQISFLGILTSLGCQLGDLFFSYLKRKANIKDTGNFLPGHGGILDRIDGILVGMPIGSISFILIY